MLALISSTHAKTTKIPIIIPCTENEKTPSVTYIGKPKTKYTLITKGLKTPDKKALTTNFIEYYNENEKATNDENVHVDARCEAKNWVNMIISKIPHFNYTKTLPCDISESLSINVFSKKCRKNREYFYHATLEITTEDKEKSEEEPELENNNTDIYTSSSDSDFEVHHSNKTESTKKEVFKMIYEYNTKYQNKK